MPVLPEVGSRIDSPGAIRPSSSARPIVERATRSVAEPVGLCPWRCAYTVAPGLGLSRLSSTSGVFPIGWMMSPYLPPQGRLTRRDSSTSESVAWARDGAGSAAGHPRQDHDRVLRGDRGVEALEHAHVL